MMKTPPRFQKIVRNSTMILEQEHFNDEEIYDIQKAFLRAEHFTRANTKRRPKKRLAVCRKW